MKLRPAWLAILTGLGLLASSAGLAATQAPASQKKEQTGKKQAAPGASLSGCIDQQEGHYVLVDDRNSGSTRPVFKVLSIETISETCAPKPQSDKKQH